MSHIAMLFRNICVCTLLRSQELYKTDVTGNVVASSNNVGYNQEISHSLTLSHKIHLNCYFLHGGKQTSLFPYNANSSY